MLLTDITQLYKLCEYLIFVIGRIMNYLSKLVVLSTVITPFFTNNVSSCMSDDLTEMVENFHITFRNSTIENQERILNGYLDASFKVLSLNAPIVVNRLRNSLELEYIGSKFNTNPQVELHNIQDFSDRFNRNVFIALQCIYLYMRSNGYLVDNANQIPMVPEAYTHFIAGFRSYIDEEDNIDNLIAEANLNILERESKIGLDNEDSFDDVLDALNKPMRQTVMSISMIRKVHDFVSENSINLDEGNQRRFSNALMDKSNSMYNFSRIFVEQAKNELKNYCDDTHGYADNYNTILLDFINKL